MRVIRIRRFDQKGTLWFTLQNSDMIGRLTPSTGDVKVVRVPTRQSQPYGIVVNSEGVPFFVELTAHRVGSIDPVSMAVSEYILPHDGTMPRRMPSPPTMSCGTRITGEVFSAAWIRRPGSHRVEHAAAPAPTVSRTRSRR